MGTITRLQQTHLITTIEHESFRTGFACINDSCCIVVMRCVCCNLVIVYNTHSSCQRFGFGCFHGIGPNTDRPTIGSIPYPVRGNEILNSLSGGSTLTLEISKASPPIQIIILEHCCQSITAVISLVLVGIIDFTAPLLPVGSIAICASHMVL